MKLINTIILTAFIGIGSFAQDLSFKVTGIKDTTVHLVKYVGSKLYYTDTAQLVAGKVTFDGSKQDPGILAVLMPGQRFFEFIYNNEKVIMETKSPNYIEHMVVKKSNENTIFLDYMKFMKTNRDEANELQEKLAKLGEEDAEEKAKLTAQIEEVGKSVLTYQDKVVKDNSTTLVSKIIKMSTDIQIPEAPKDADGKVIDKAFAYKYFREHFFDNIDLNDDRLVNTPVLQNKIEYFYSKNMLTQHPDTIIKYVFPVINSIPEESMMYRFVVNNVTTHFEKSKFMGMDKVKTRMVSSFYCAPAKNGNPKAHWMDQEKLKELCENTKIQMHLVQGEVPPNLILPDSTNQKWYNLHEVEADYIILFFWDPGCGHCKKVTPKLQTLYEKKFKERNIEIYSVGKATGDDFEDWKKFIKDKKLTYINVGVTRDIYEQASENPYSLIPSKTTIESINYQSTYDIYSTPRVWILDKDKKIIAKSLSIPQIEMLLDDLQGFKDIDKLFKMDENTEEIR
ncbi:redoxin domain-containing protein [Brumimicrobium glaciale]|uniref:Redoxin domain-containing protein n=1 Tax=Brumimicrobium glaciale TaxID=200475 RepID=A0A4Q4KFK6_9FLAO|nr:thioredoxin-like domain-containing protein [Brumimicrobium glaciale]RYM31460.1 redoxin domain-containing protein [Brumimicrobium glaciale]